MPYLNVKTFLPADAWFFKRCFSRVESYFIRIRHSIERWNPVT